jgi:gas vesicle protein
MSHHEETQDIVNNIGWFVAGAVAGMTAALLLAPQTGKRTRRLLADKTQQGRDAVAETGQDVVDRSKDIVDKGRQLVEDALELFERGRKLVRG